MKNKKYDPNDIRKLSNIVLLIIVIILYTGIIVLAFYSGLICGKIGDLCIKSIK